MPSDDAIEVVGTVVKVLPATMYKVKLENGHEVLAHISGKMRKFFIKIAAGDKVTFGLRPEHLQVGVAGGIEARVDVLEYLGGTRYLYCQLTDGQLLIVEYRDGPDVRSGDTITLGCPPDRRYIFNEGGSRIR